MSRQLHRRGSRPPGSWRVGPVASTWPRPACHPLVLPPVPFSEGTPHQRGPREPGAGTGAYSGPGSGAPWGSLAKALAPQSQAVGVRPCLFGGSRPWVEDGPLCCPPMPCMGPTSGQWSLGEGEPQGHAPTQEGPVTPGLSSRWGEPGVIDLPPARGGDQVNHSLSRAPAPTGPSFLLVLIWGPQGPPRPLLQPAWTRVLGLPNHTPEIRPHLPALLGLEPVRAVEGGTQPGTEASWVGAGDPHLPPRPM